MRTVFFWLPIAVALAASSAGAAEVVPTAYPFLPELVVDKEPDVCGPFHAALTTEFLGNNFELNLSAESWPEADVSAVVFAPIIESKQRRGVDLAGATIDVDPTHKGRLLAYIISNAGMHSDHSFHVFADQQALVTALDRASNNEGRFLDTYKLYANDAGVVEEGTVVGDQTYLGEESWMASAFFRVNGAYYVVRREDNHEHDWYDPKAFSLLRIAEAGPWPVVCRVTVIASDHMQPTGPLAETPVGQLEQLLKSIAGRSTPASGSRGTLEYVIRRGEPVGARVALRPWSAASFEAFGTVADVRAWLGYWGTASLSNWRVVRKLAQVETQADRVLQQYYLDAFGVPEDIAAEWSRQARDALRGAYFMFPPQLHDLDLENPKWQLRHLLLNGTSWEKIVALVPLDAQEAPRSGWFEMEPLAVYALEQPDLLNRLLLNKVNANEGNGFGKTALMYAAQFNLREAAAVLLEHNAQVNAVTAPNNQRIFRSFTGGGYAISFWSRTPLMYAAENAGVEMTLLLLEAGANPNARDSGNRDMMDYLDLNTSLKDEDRTAIELMLREAGYVKTAK